MPISADVQSLAGIVVNEGEKPGRAIDDGIWTTLEASPEHPIARLIREANNNKHVWHVEGLWQPNTILLVHSLEGEFKSVLAYQMSEALATGQPLLRKWRVPVPVRVGALQTEMPENMVGERLRAMYPEGRIPCNLIPSDLHLKADLRICISASEKFQVIHNWVMREGIDVLVWDTINNALSSCGNPNSEEAAAQFYHRLESLPHKGALVVRHDSKPSKDSENRQSNQRVRGSNLHAEIASAVIHMHRPDKRSTKAQLEIGKLRHDSAPEPMDCWFDAGTMRLTLLPPHIALLEGGAMTRDALNDQLLRRFGFKERTADEQTRQLQAEGHLIPHNRGHERVWALNRAVVPNPESPALLWQPLVNLAEPEEIAEPHAYPQDICEVGAVEK